MPSVSASRRCAIRSANPAGVAGTACRGHDDVVLATAFSSDATHLLTASRDGRLILRDTDSGRGIKISPDVTTESAALSPDGTLVAAAQDDGTTSLWTPADDPANNLLHALTGHVGVVRSVTFSPDGSSSSPPAMTGRRGSGTVRAAPPPDAQWTYWPRKQRRIQPRRKGGPHRRRRRDRCGVGHRQWPPADDADGSRGRCQPRSLQPRRKVHRHSHRGRGGADLGVRPLRRGCRRVARPRKGAARIERRLGA
jgi:hypothetical protein